MFGLFRRKSKPNAVVVVPVRRKRGRPTREEAAERRKMQLAEIKTKVELRKLERELAKTDVDDDDASLRVDDVARINRQLRQIGMTIAPIDGRSGAEGGLVGSLRSLLDTEAGRGIGQVAGGVLANALTGGAVIMAPQPAPPLLPAGPSLPPPAAAVAEVPAVEPEPAPEAPLSATAQLVTNYVIGQLENKTPAETAGWVINNPNQQIREFAEAIRRTPDEHLPELLSRMATQYPDLRGVADWLRSRPEWLVATARAIRAAGMPGVEQGA